ncbi:expressed protein [Phakopsora pachyrhizi]|uniref:Expressed protein n=1 Tax=Phakopsora pachyrhizi TaxID=170000 RepID=A0AAV0AHL9_PHAPC|nr:expressed protein [Phakopsora pachyrhizi]
MSISPERFGGSALGRVSQERNEDRGILGKRRMIWDPEFGFLTEEQRDKMKLEAEHQLREKEGRPLPTNEAEKILEVLETVGGFNSDSSGKRRGSYLPSIPYPTPGRTHGRHPSSTKLSQRLTATNSLAAVYEEQALRSNSSTIIAPISKKLEADRIKRLEEKKGKLRAELRKRKQIAEMHIRESEKLVEKEDKDIACNERLLRRSDRLRSTSVEPSGVTGPPRRSKRKIGKLTSDAVRAKVNSGRSSRSQSVNEDEQAQGTTIKTGRVTRSAKSNLLNSNGRPELSHKVSPPNSLSKSAGRAHKQIDSASPILEDPLDVGNMVASSLPGMRKPDSATASQPLMRASSTFFKSTLSSAVKSTPLSSLRPGRTFSSRRHIKAKVFSAREEHLPPLDDDEDEERVKENEALKKIKLPSTLPSSFRLEKFASPDLTENNLTKRVNDEEKSSVPNHGESSKNPKEEGMLAKNSASSLCPISGTVPSSSLAVASASVATKAPTSTSIFTAKTDASKAVENPVPSLFFQPQKDEQTNSKDNIQHFSSLNGIKRIPSDSTAPDFFKTVSQPDKSSDPKESETPIFFGLKPVASTSLFGATPSSVTENAKELAAHDKASSNLKSDLVRSSKTPLPLRFRLVLQSLSCMTRVVVKILLPNPEPP